MKSILFVTLSLIFTQTLWGAIPKISAKEALQKRKSGLTSRITHKRMETAFRYSHNKKYKEAAETLIRLLKQTKNRKYEYAVVWQNFGLILAQAGQHDKAIKALENSLKLNVLPYGQTLSSLYTVSQLYFAQENFTLAHERLAEWFVYAEKPKAQAYMLMGMILGQMDQKEKALDNVNHAINMEVIPPEKWLQYALSLNHSLKKYKNAVKILVTLTSQYPTNGRYWKQLYQTYLSLFEDEKALAIMEMAYKEKHLDQEGELLNMARLMVYLKMPFKAAQIIEKEMTAGLVSKNKNNYEFLSQAWYQAKEMDKALWALEQAGNSSQDGKLFAKKGYMLLESDKFAEAITSFEKSLAKGKVKEKSQIYFAMGLAYYNKKDFSGALKSLKQASKYDKDNSSILSWIEQIKNQQVAMNEL